MSNSIREDPRKKGLLYAATDLQAWVSFDDGDHWESIKYDMPPVSIRDIQVKDDSTCLCADLVAGTHGRGFWILDDVTPFRQAADLRAAKAANKAFLAKPTTAVRVRYSTNDPTPWPPETPGGENALPGGLIDYYLSANASSPVVLEILDAAGKRVRHYTSADTGRNPHPALDPVAYNKWCQSNPGGADCGLPLYWPAPPLLLSAAAGAHRFSWDLHYDPIGADAGFAPGGGAVPYRTFPGVGTPFAPPGNYTVKLTVDGASYTQPLTLKLDPRVKTSASALAKMDSLTRDLYRAAVTSNVAATQAHALSAKLDGFTGLGIAEFKAQVDSVAGAAGGGRGGRGGFGGPPGGGRGGAGGPPAPPTLSGASAALMAAANGFAASEMAPTATRLQAATAAKTEAAAAMKKWTALSITGLAALNTKRKAAGLPVVAP